MLVLGLMSGTSADAIDVALARISGAPPRLSTKLENYVSFPYPRAARAAILRLANGGTTTTAELSQLNFLVGELFAGAALAACARFRISPRRVRLIGSHGQTVFHQGTSARFLGMRRVASTLQIGEPAVIAARTGITTVADFRPADMAAGGQGAPLVSFVDYLLYRDERRGRVALNIGGIANVTVIPRAAGTKQVLAFDTGPGNMVIDALAQHYTRGRETYDRAARMARRGHPIRPLLDELLTDPFFRTPPPKSAGREQFGAAYVQHLLTRGQKLKARPEDMVATATLLTPLAILDAFHRWILPRAHTDQLIVSGGGAHNPLILAQLEAGLRGIEIIASAELGLPEDAKEAFAFAVLAYETFHGRPTNLPSATGAHSRAILGKIVHAPPR